MTDAEPVLAGRVAIVTGGGAGIGRATSRRLAAAGALVVVVDVDATQAEAAVDEITTTGGRATADVVDVRDAVAVRDLAARVLATHGRVDVLVNNVGHHLGPQRFVESTEEHWAALHDVNLLHVFRVTHAFLPAMLERGSGSIVNVSSVEGLRGFPPDPVYAAYKAAVVHFTRSLAVDVGGAGVRVTAIAPDVTDSIQVPYDRLVPDDERHLWPAWVPVGRMGVPDDQAEVILFLASDAARFVTGHTIPTDGGTLAAGGWFRRDDPGGRAWTNRPRRA